MFIRFRRSTGVERQQLKWFAFASTLLAVYFVVSAILEAVGISEGPIGQIVSGLVFAGIPVAVGIAILQYRLWDLDVVVKKAVVAGALVVLAVGVYAGAVALIGALTVDDDRPALLFAIALALGIAFRPVMRVGRRVADRLVYGRRATPYEVLTEFSERMGTSYATEDVLPRMAQVLGEGTGAEIARDLAPRRRRVPRCRRPGPAIRRRSTAVSPRTAAGSTVPGEAVTEVRDRGELLGALSRPDAGVRSDEPIEGPARARPRGSGRVSSCGTCGSSRTFAPRGSGSLRRRTRSAGGWSGTSTTVPSSSSSPSR